MKLEKINENKLKIIFNADELEENNISVHSFLSNSLESQKLFIAILDIANEDLGFDISNSQISYEAFSFNNTSFVIFVTKIKTAANHNISCNLNTENSCKHSPFTRDFNFPNNSSFNFIGNTMCNSNKNQAQESSLIYTFQNIEEVFEFSDFLISLFPIINFKNSLYQYNDIFFIEILVDDLSASELKKISANLSEIKTSYTLTELSKRKFKEYSQLLIKNNAIQRL